MCDEKRKVINVLRALLILKEGGPVTLRELKQDFCTAEGKKEIPKFEYKNVIDFLDSSGKFILNVFNGEVIVLEKPKSKSLHINRHNANQKVITGQSDKTSDVFTFEKLDNGLSNDTVDANSLETKSLHSQEQIESQSDIIITPDHEGKSLTSVDQKAQSVCVSIICYVWYERRVFVF